MSRALEYAARCEECGKPMRPGTIVDFFKVGNDYRYIHAGTCEREPSVQPVVRHRPTFDDVWDTRECSREGCYGHHLAFRKGQASPRCPYCDSPWAEDVEDATDDVPAPAEFAIPEFDRP